MQSLKNDRTTPRSSFARLALLSVGFLVTSTTASLAAGVQQAAGPAIPKASTQKTSTAKSSASAKKTSSKSSSSAKKTSSAKSPSAKKTSSGWGQGSSGAKVLELQELLKAQRYDIGEPDGKFGIGTYHAVMAFQKANGLPRTGRASDQLLELARTAPEPEPLLPEGGPDRVEVDLPNQFLKLYQGGELKSILSISSGSGKNFCVLDPETGKTTCEDANTPGGSFRVTRRILGWRESKLGLLFNPLYFNGGIAIHGAPSVPATPASHGCVRIPMPSSEWFPDMVADGTPIYVWDGEKPLVPLRPRTPTTLPGQTTVPTTKVGQTTIPGVTTVPTPTTDASATTLPGQSTVPGTTSIPTTTALGQPATTSLSLTTTSTTPTGPVIAGVTTTTVPGVRLLTATTTVS